MNWIMFYFVLSCWISADLLCHWQSVGDAQQFWSIHEEDDEPMNEEEWVSLVNWMDAAGK